MSERTASTGKLILITVFAGGLIWTIANYATSFIKSKSPACEVKAGMLGNFQSPDGTVLAPDTVFFDGADNKRRITDLIGRGVVLNFWASWCAPCVREMPQLDKLKYLTAEKNVDVLAVSQDRQGAPAVRNFLLRNKLLNLEVLIDKESKLIRAVNGQGLPTTILFNPEGREIGRVIGVAEWDKPEVVTFIQNCLGS